jgi:hypothetical protein
LRHVTEDEIRIAYEFLADGENDLTAEILYSHMRDFKFHNYREMIGEKSVMKYEELRDFLLLNTRFVAEDADNNAMKV